MGTALPHGRRSNGLTPTLDRAQIDRLVADARVATLGTLEPDGRAHLVPVTFALIGNRMYTAIDHKPKSTTDLKRLRNIERDPRVTLLIHSYDEEWLELWWCRLRGHAHVVQDEDGINALVAKYDQYRSRRPDGPLIVIDIAEWTGWTATARE